MTDLYELAKTILFWAAFGLGAAIVVLWLVDRALTMVCKSLRVYRTLLEFYCNRKAYYAWLNRKVN